jgi:TRAP-type C4-dicarboxylate transport system permease small subunit
MGTGVKAFVRNFEEIISVILLAAMAALAFANVLTRYFIHYSFAFSEEIEVALLVWITMLGAAACFRRGLHLGFNYLAEKMPVGIRKALTVLSGVLMIFVCAVIFRYSLIHIRDEIEMSITTEALGIPQWWYTIAIPVGLFFIVLRVIEATVAKLREKA